MYTLFFSLLQAPDLIGVVKKRHIILIQTSERLIVGIWHARLAWIPQDSLSHNRQPIVIMKCSNILPIGILLLILICSEFSLIKAEDPPLADIHSHITPGELLIRLTPEASADVERLHANAPIFTLHAKHNIQSLHPLFPYLARPSLNPNLEAYLPIAVFA